MMGIRRVKLSTRVREAAPPPRSASRTAPRMVFEHEYELTAAEGDGQGSVTRTTTSSSCPGTSSSPRMR